MTVQLYKKEPCLFCERCRISLLEKKISFEEITVDVRNKPDWFLALSPSGKVPVLKRDDCTVFDSVVINEYLDEAFPEIPLRGYDLPGTVARVHSWMESLAVRPSVVATCPSLEANLANCGRYLPKALHIDESTSVAQ